MEISEMLSWLRQIKPEAAEEVLRKLADRLLADARVATPVLDHSLRELCSEGSVRLPLKASREVVILLDQLAPDTDLGTVDSESVKLVYDSIQETVHFLVCALNGSGWLAAQSHLRCALIEDPRQPPSSRMTSWQRRVWPGDLSIVGRRRIGDLVKTMLQDYCPADIRLEAQLSMMLFETATAADLQLGALHSLVSAPAEGIGFEFAGYIVASMRLLAVASPTAAVMQMVDLRIEDETRVSE